MLPKQVRKQFWINNLANEAPDLVINTGDNLSSPKSIPFVLSALGDLLNIPGAFVFGSNDYFAPKFKNPLHYFKRDTTIRDTPITTELPWKDLATSFEERGWLNVTHKVKSLKIKGIDIIIGGLDDPHMHKDDFDQIRQHMLDIPSSKNLLKFGVTHSPEPRVLDQFLDVGTDFVFAGHTHGGQIGLPFYGPLISNSALDPKKAKGISVWKNKMKLHVSSGLGTSPFAPFRLFTRPEATIITFTSK